MKWFTEVFLPSISERLKNTDEHGGGYCWISDKQAMICRKYMKEKPNYPGLYIVVGDYQYSVTFTKNGYARFTKTDKRCAYR